MIRISGWPDFLTIRPNWAGRPDSSELFTRQSISRALRPGFEPAEFSYSRQSFVLAHQFGSQRWSHPDAFDPLETLSR